MLNVCRCAEATALFEEAIERGGEGTGWLWDGVFAAILAIRTGRLHDAQALLEVESDGQNMLSDVAFAGNLGAALLELALAEGRFEEGRAKADEVLGGLAGKDEVRFQSRSLQFAIRIESELAAVARARRDRGSEERAQARGVAKLELLHVRMDELSDDVSPVFGEARRNTALEDGVPLASVTARDPFGLTAREREVLALVAEGYTNRRIADALFITESTAGVHVSTILAKLRVTNRVEAAAVALRLGLSAGGPSPVAT